MLPAILSSQYVSENERNSLFKIKLCQLQQAMVQDWGTNDVKITNCILSRTQCMRARSGQNSSSAFKNVFYIVLCLNCSFYVLKHKGIHLQKMYFFLFSFYFIQASLSTCLMSQQSSRNFNFLDSSTQSNMPIQFCQLQMYRYVRIIGIMLYDSLSRISQASQLCNQG